MNLKLGFEDPNKGTDPNELEPQSAHVQADQAMLRRPAGLEGAVARFTEWQGDENSPVRSIHHQLATEGEFADIPAEVAAPLHLALASRGIKRLYSHQAEAFSRSQQGENVVVVTPTASGKTLCYNLPVLHTLAQDPTARALYLFPTKALAEDQLQEFLSTVDGTGDEAKGEAPIRAFTYDGDTPQDARRAIRERANVVFTNPDMLHSGILPHHTKWAKLFENLQYFVIDELHYYRGVYGSHLGNVVRRLRRICEFYGSNPKFLCCSATIANPKELAEKLCEASFSLIDSNGAPKAEKYFVFYNPPIVNRELGIRRSYLHESRRIALEFLDRGQQTLIFTNNRLATEVLTTYLKDAAERLPSLRGKISGYRGGYLPKERRKIEKDIRSGVMRGIVATNALELGVDIGSLDAVVMAGYPGTVASTWQRAGRAGRRGRLSMAVLVASSAPLDQYIVEHPEYFFQRAPEQAHINPNNLEIRLNHLKCAAFELPLRDGESFGGPDTPELCRFLQEMGLLHHTNETWHWTSDTYPADAVSLRAVTSDNFVVVDITRDNEVIAEVDFPSALTSLHEKAIYLHDARQYQVEKFDYDGRKAYVRAVDTDYFTDAIDYTQVKILTSFDEQPLADSQAVWGEVRVNRQIVGFKKVKFYTLENVGAGHLSIPEQEMHTTSFWIHFPADFLAKLEGYSPTEKQQGLVGLGNACRAIAALLLMCDPRDLGVSLTEDSTQGARAYEPNLYLYDNYPGGIGGSEPLFRRHVQLLSAANDLVMGCVCTGGCPSCVGPVGEVGEKGKEVATKILAALLTPALGA